MFNKIREIYQGIRNIIRWIPTLYRDRDYDQAYLLEMMQKKILYMAKYIEKRKRFEGWENAVDRMYLCCNLIHHYLEETYGMEPGNYVDGKISFEKIPESENYLMKMEVFSETLDKYFEKNKLLKKKAEIFCAKYPHKEKGNTEEEKIIHDKIHLSRIMGKLKQDKSNNLLFKVLSKEFQNWWD